MDEAIDRKCWISYFSPQCASEELSSKNSKQIFVKLMGLNKDEVKTDHNKLGKSENLGSQ